MARRNVNPTKAFQAQLKKAMDEAANKIAVTRLKSNFAIDYELRKQSIVKLKEILVAVYDELGLDTEQLHRKFDVIRRSEYGQIPALINILAATYAWPVPQGADASGIAQAREDMIAFLWKSGYEVDGDLLSDIKDAKGYHSFMNDEGEVVEAIEPAYEEYDFLLLTAAEKLGLFAVDNKLNPEAWHRAEEKALQAIADEREKHKELAESNLPIAS